MASQPTQTSQDAGLPRFLEHPDRIDIFLIVMVFVIAVFSLALIPLRAWLMGHPLGYTLLVGGYTSSVIGGAHASAGQGQWWVYWLCTVVGALKFMPFYFWMGRRWGMDFVDLSVQYTPRVKKLVTRAVASSKSRGVTGALIPLGYCPGPVPTTIVNAVFGLLKAPWAAMIALNISSILCVNGVFLALGWAFGDAVLAVVDVVNRYLLWITLALVAVAIFQAARRSKAV